MIINNTVIHTHDLIHLLENTYTLSKIPNKTYRIKFNGAFIRIKNKSDWDRLSSAKSAFKAFLKRNDYTISSHISKINNSIFNYYYCTKEDIDAIYNQLIADNVLEFVEMSN